jgi:uncharacterized Zn finger protein
MSYEGFTQHLCEDGHSWTVDAYLGEDIETCPFCGKLSVWHNSVDTTNGSFDDNGIRIDGYVELEKKKEVRCDKCGSITEITYKIPESRTIEYKIGDEDDGYPD